MPVSDLRRQTSQVIQSILRGRVPIVLSLSGLGDLGEVGIIEVDAQTGEIISGETAQERILQHAQQTDRPTYHTSTHASRFTLG